MPRTLALSSLTRAISATLLGSLLLGAHCQPSAVESSTSSPEALEFSMQQHFTGVSEIKNAVIAGDLETVHEAAQRLVEREAEATYPVAWRPHASDLLQAAQAVATADDIPTAAARTARLSATCGACHVTLDAVPSFPMGLEPSEEDTLAAQMERHQWAADRLWEGIVGPSTEAWIRGSEVFPSIPTCETAFEAEGEYARSLCTKVTLLGQRAKSAASPSDQARIYGEFLGTCATCHHPPS